MLAKEEADRDSGDRVEMTRVVLGLDAFAGIETMQGIGAATKFASHVNGVAGPGTRAEDGEATGHGSQDNNVGEDSSGRLSSIAAGQGNPKLPGKSEEALQEAVDPILG
jgi:hypothetical protein